MLAELIDFIEDNFTIDVESSIISNALNQPMVKLGINKIGYSIVDNQNGSFEVGVIGEDNLIIYENQSADDVIGVITTYSNKQLINIMNDRNALKHGIVY